MATVLFIALLQAKTAIMQPPPVGPAPGVTPQISAPQTAGATRLQQCNTSCAAVDGKPVYTTACHDLMPATAIDADKPRLPAAAAMALRRATAVPASPAVVVRPRYTSMAPGTMTRQLADAGQLAAIREPSKLLQGLICPARVQMQIIRTKSPNCWIPDGRYCRYKPAGLIGYSCTCGNHSGEFG